MESRLERRRAELDRMREVHARYCEKMSQHRQLVDCTETSTLQTDRLHDRIQQLSTESQSDVLFTDQFSVTSTLMTRVLLVYLSTVKSCNSL